MYQISIGAQHHRSSRGPGVERIPLPPGVEPVAALFQRAGYSHPVDFATGVRYDQTVRPTGVDIRHDYPAKLRRIKFYDAANNRTFVFLTNHFELPAATIAALYAEHWQIELFFRWVKQNLRIKTFYGTSDNAVKTQIWVTICVYVLVAIVKKELQLKQSLYEILQIVSVTPFEQIPLQELLAKNYDSTSLTSPAKGRKGR